MTLAELRFNHEKLTQKQLASLLRVDRSAISKWESGKQVPDRETAQRIAEIFDKPFAEIDRMFLKQKQRAERQQPEWQRQQVAMDLAENGGGVCHQ